MNAPTEEQWRELSSFASSISLHEGDLWRAKRDRSIWGVVEAFQDLQQDVNNIRLWLDGGQCANTTEEGDKE